jgi:hypothetical protein
MPRLSHRAQTPQVLFLFLLGHLIPGAVFAQSPSVAIDDLKSPASPGFAVLGVEPAVISRPTSPRGVTLSLLSADRDGDTLVPKNYALEVAPYWLASHPNLTYDQYDSAGVTDTLRQTTSVSFATSRIPASLTQPISTGLGFGVRALAARGRPNSQIADLTARIKKLQADILNAKTPQEEDKIEADLRNAALDFQAQNRKRVGWMLEMAGAFAAQYPGDNVENGRLSKFGFWVTPSYQLEAPRLNATAVARYLRERRVDGIDVNLSDVGIRLQADAEEFGVSVEVLRRFVGETTPNEPNSTRVMGLLDYRVSPDIYLTASFGQDFANILTTKKPLVSFLGLNFGLSKTPVVQLP